MEPLPQDCRSLGNSSCVAPRRAIVKQFVEEFVSSLAPPKVPNDPVRPWTRAIRERFHQICPGDAESIPHDSTSTKEYLVDFVWLEKESGGRILLACECEWASDNYGRQTYWGYVEEDFEKLLAIKAPFKVLIFSSTASDHRSRKARDDDKIDFTIETAKERLSNSLANYWHHLAGETYLFLDFPATGEIDGSGRYESFVWIAESSGRVNLVKFDDLSHGELNLPQP